MGNYFCKEMLVSVITLALILLLPALILYLKKRVKIIEWISPIVVCYMIGIIAGNLNFLPLNSILLRNVAEVSVCLATPMLLFSCDFLKWVKNSRNTIISFFLGTIAVVICSTIAFLLLKGQIDEGWKVAGMTVGLYTGATVNLTAIGIALQVAQETFIVMNSADLLFGGLYFLFLITLGKKVFGLILPAYKKDNERNADINDTNEINPLLKFSLKRKFAEVKKSIAIAIPIVGVIVGLSLLLFNKMESTLIILGITTLGIVFSFNKKISGLKYNYEAGDYLLLMFSIALGAMANYTRLVTGNLPIVMFVATVVFSSILLQLIMAYFFKLQDDTVIITSAAVIFGPAFILPIADAIKNREVIVAGLSMALLGNAFGTYLGIALAYCLDYLF
ncbi:MAG TPA: DUF819 family protein [Lentimicrobium sp.]|nr:DUF819 family protein [Lentimicrobium sp.]